MKKISLFLIYPILFIFFLEFLSRILFRYEFENYDKRVMLFSEGKTFINLNDFFLYKPNTNFISNTFYLDSNHKSLNSEYRYKVTSNNAGLIQKKDIKKNIDSIFILGASETKGQGAIPWFYKLESDFNHPYQLINIGMIGTGPAQQKKLFDFVKKEYELNIKKIILIFSDGYFSRSLWNFNNQQLDCLDNYKLCLGTEGIYGYKFEEKKEKEFAKKIIDIRTKYEFQLSPVILSYKNKKYFQAFKEILKLSYFVKKIYLLKRTYQNEGAKNINQGAILDLQAEYKNKFYIIQMRSKNQQYNRSELNYVDLKYKKFLEDNNLIKNYQFCIIPDAGFHLNDSHANNLGYSYLRKCVEEIANKLLD